MPVLTPAELWKASGRYDKFDVLMKLRDGSEREFVLAATHEETVTFHARELRSYRDLPKILYHFQTKERDEQRPRGGLLRVREFVMKDAYSFDRDEAGLDVGVPGARRRLRAHLRALRARGRCRPGRVGNDGRQRVDRLPRAVGVGREHARHVRARRLRGRSRDRARRPAPARVPRHPHCAGAGRDARDHDVRGPRGLPRDRRRRHLEGDAGRQRRSGRAGARARRRPAGRGEARRRARRRLPPRADGRDPAGVRRRARLARACRVQRTDRARRRPPSGTVRRRRESHRLPPARRRARPRLRGGDRGHPPLARGRRVPALRRRPAVRDGDRGRSHLQARHVLLGAARRDLPRRGSRSSGRS